MNQNYLRASTINGNGLSDSGNSNKDHRGIVSKVTGLLAIFFCFLIVSCNVSYQNICGTYKLKDFPKTTLILNADSSFLFTQNYPNPYLHPFPHPDEYFFRTQGKWHSYSRIIELIGTPDSLEYSLANILSIEPTNNQKSNFKFKDEEGEIVPILYVEYSNGSGSSVLHSTMDEFEEDLTKRDSLQFYFFGYRPWTLIHGQQTNNNYVIELKPMFLPNAIDSLYLKLKKNVIGSKMYKLEKDKSM